MALCCALYFAWCEKKIPHTPTIKVGLFLNMSATTTVTQAVPITAQSILQLFPDIDTSSAELDGHDEEQIRLMDEVCIVLDENDKPIGNFSKKICESLFLSRSSMA